MSRRLLTTSNAVANKPTGTAAIAARAVTRAEAEIGGADDRNEAEEDEDEDLPEARVPVRPRPGRVEPAGGEAGRAHDEQPGRRGKGEHEAGHARHPEGTKGRRLDGPRGRAAGSDEPSRARAARHLCPGSRPRSRWRSSCRSGSRGRRRARRASATRRPNRRRPRRRSRREQGRPRPGGCAATRPPPSPASWSRRDRAQGRRGNREKSGRRFST